MLVNQKVKLSEVFPVLDVGMEIFTNGDGSFDSDEFFFGTVCRKTVTEIHVTRSDGEGGEGPDGSWVIQNIEDNPTVVIVLDRSKGRERAVRFLRPTDIFMHNTIFYTFVERLHTGVSVRKLGSSDDLITLQALGHEDKVLYFFPHPLLTCSQQGCPEPAYKAIGGVFYCKTHFDVIAHVECHECGATTARVASREVTDGSARIRICNDCYREWADAHKTIHNYSYKPKPVFIIGNPVDKSLQARIFMGIEQEVECPDNPETMGAEVIRKFRKTKQWFYLKSDGSLTRGFELVTHPANLEGHYDLPWLRLGEHYAAHGIKAEETDTCGLHIHTNKETMDEEHQIRMAYFVNSQREQMEKIARRPACRWAKFKRANHPIRELHKSSGDKYEALNWLPSATVEFRLFKGATDAKTVLSSIEFVQSVILFTENQKLDYLKNRDKAWMAYQDFLATNKYKFLPDYLTARGIS